MSIPINNYSNMKKNYYLSVLMLSFFLVVSLLSVNATAADIYVALNGSDNNTGTKEQPLASVAMALRKARELRRLNDTTVRGGIHIYVDKGVYRLAEQLFIRPEDSGTESSPTYIEAVAGEQPVLSGGVLLT